MRVDADQVSVNGPHGTLLPTTSLRVRAGELAVVHGDPGAGLTTFGLALAGRIRLSTGTVTVDGAADPARLRELVAVVDAPSVSEPEESLSLRAVAGEELALAGKPATKEDVATWLTAHDCAALANLRFEELAAATRTRLLTTLAAARPGVRMLVLDRPDRHTSDFASWLELAREHARRGFAVVVLVATTPPSVLPTPPAQVGGREQPDPERCLELEETE